MYIELHIRVNTFGFVAINLFSCSDPEYVVTVLHSVQKTPLKRTCKYFEMFRSFRSVSAVFWDVSRMSNFLYFLRINFYVNVF